MLAEIFLLRLEATARAAKEAAVTSSNLRFVPIVFSPVARPGIKFRGANCDFYFSEGSTAALLGAPQLLFTGNS